MRTLIVADVHSNLTALRAVIADAGGAGGIDHIWCLGDTVGYGPEPNECVEVLRSYPVTAIAGNHDLAAVGLLSTEEFNLYALEALEWTATQLNDDAHAWLSSLPETMVDGDFTLVHGSLTNPAFDYLMSARDAAQHLLLQTTAYGLVGHSHLALAFSLRGRGLDGRPLRNGATIALEGTRFVANPGSVGQPRDGDPRAAYAVLDTGTNRIDFCRVSYDVAKTQAKIIAAGLPDYLAERLREGR